MKTFHRPRKLVLQVNWERYLSINSSKLSTKLTKCLIKFKWRILFKINILLALNCPSFVRINQSIVEHIVFSFLYLSDNCCNLFSSNRVNLVSEFLAILRQQQSGNNFQTFSRLPVKKRPGTRAITNGGQ